MAGHLQHGRAQDLYIAPVARHTDMPQGLTTPVADGGLLAKGPSLRVCMWMQASCPAGEACCQHAL